jgi:hypothetical protein
VKSFDLFDTLVAAPDPAIPAGDQERHFSIAENVAAVQPGDIIISDYYDAKKAAAVLALTGLTNQLHVSENDKRNGRAWQLFRPELHTGDNLITDRNMPQQVGIQTKLVLQGMQTGVEQHLHQAGFSGLANLIREARLKTWHLTLRAFQDVQTQINFPLLFLLSLLLHREAQTRQTTSLLMSARDSCLWVKMQRKVSSLLNGGYRTHYFYTSRLARTFPSESYLAYTEELLKGRPLVVDLCGYGHTLPKLLEHTSGSSVILAVKYPHPVSSPASTLLTIKTGSLIERANLARHPMVVDVKPDGSPVYSNPANIAWEDVPQIRVMHEAFDQALQLFEHYDLAKDVQQPTPQIQKTAEWLVNWLSQHQKTLMFDNDLMAREEQPILDKLKLASRLPSPKNQDTTSVAPSYGRAQQQASCQDTSSVVPVVTATVLTRLHCEMPYFGQLAIPDGMTAQVLNRLRTNGNACVGSNSERMARDFEVVAGKPCFYLPSVYPIPSAPARRPGPKETDNVACFGRVFSLKNITVQAIAALRFTKARGTRLRFHVNDFSADANGQQIVNALKLLFDRQPNAELILHKWYPHEAFIQVLSTMTIGLQVSLTEASNVISLDMVAAGLPVVTSPEIKWATEQSTCYPTNSEAIAERMHYAMSHPELIDEHKQNIQAHNDSCFATWQRFIGPNARVLFLVHNALNTGISTVATNDCAMLKANGVQAEIERTNFAPDAVSKAIQRYRPTHVISEASWRPLEATR